MTKRGADGFSLVFRSLLSIRFLRCVPLQRVRSGEEGGDIGSRRLSRNVISSEVEKSFLLCCYPCQCENENRRLCVSFPCCITSAVYGVCQKDPSAALGMTKRGADGFSLVFRSLPSIRFLRCVPLQRVRSGEKCQKDCGERSSRIVAEYNRQGGTLAAGGFLVTSFRAKSRNLPCPAVIHVSVKMKIDVFVFRFPAVSRRPFMGLLKRSLDCARDDETGSGWFLTRFQIAAIHPLPSACPSSKISRSRSK